MAESQWSNQYKTGNTVYFLEPQYTGGYRLWRCVVSAIEYNVLLFRDCYAVADPSIKRNNGFLRVGIDNVHPDIKSALRTLDEYQCEEESKLGKRMEKLQQERQLTISLIKMVVATEESNGQGVSDGRSG